MASNKQSTEMVDQTTGEIIEMDDMMAELSADADQFSETFDTDELIIPRLAILQDLSPQVKENKAEYVPGAKIGMIYNPINNALNSEIIFVPAKYTVSWIAWQPHPIGGMVDPDVDEAFLKDPKNGFVEDGIDRYVGRMTPRNAEDPVKVEVLKTAQWIGIALGDSGWQMPVALSFPSTKARAAKKINTAINLTEVEVAPGVFKQPPAFWNNFTMTTGIETSGNNEWFGWQITPNDWKTTDKRMRLKAKEIRESFDRGEAKVSSEGEQ